MWVVIFLALVILPSFSRPTSLTGIVFYVLFLLVFGYAVFRTVIRSFFAKLVLQGEVITFSSIGERKEVSLSDIRDIDFLIKANRRAKNKQRDDDLYLLSSDASTVIHWNIASGWTQDVISVFTEVVRTRLKQRGIKTFPLLESKAYDSVLTR